MKTVFKLSIMLFLIGSSCSVTIFSQEKLYVNFIPNGNEYFIKENGAGNIVKEALYGESLQPNGDIIFYVKAIKFYHQKSRMKKRENILLKSEQLILPGDIKSRISTIMKDFIFDTSTYPLPKKYPQLFIAKKQEEKYSYTIYEVQWQYYIE